MESSSYQSFRPSPEDNHTTVGNRIRRMRRSAQMTQEKLADVLGVSVNYIGEVERGNKPLSRSLADQLCSYFHVTYDYLYHGISPPPQYFIHENVSYKSLHTFLVEKLEQCSPEEILIISQLVNCYLDISRKLKNQNAAQNSQDADQGSRDKKGTPDFP